MICFRRVYQCHLQQAIYISKIVIVIDLFFSPSSFLLLWSAFWEFDHLAQASPSSVDCEFSCLCTEHRQPTQISFTASLGAVSGDCFACIKTVYSRKCVAGDGGGREGDGEGRGCEDSSSSRGLCTSIEDGAVSSDPISQTPSLFLANCSLHCIYCWPLSYRHTCH